MKCYMMKRHRSFELGSAKVLEGMGYVNIDVTRGVADWGADVFCEKDLDALSSTIVFLQKKKPY